MQSLPENQTFVLHVRKYHFVENNLDLYSKLFCRCVYHGIGKQLHSLGAALHINCGAAHQRIISVAGLRAWQTLNLIRHSEADAWFRHKNVASVGCWFTASGVDF